jgi:hypothetical protein
MNLLSFIQFLNPVSLMYFLDLVCFLYILSLMSLSSSSRRSNKLLYNGPELCIILNKMVLLSIYREKCKHTTLHMVIESSNFYFDHMGY